MMSTVVNVEHLSKRYSIGLAGGGVYQYGSLRDSIAAAATSAWGRLLRKHAGRDGHPDHIWALDDVSFAVECGEVVGIIGRNGAGKSTLLKVLSRITRPTRGFADICGRLGSLLEVGTGFHPELTGRENIYLNGAILGMRRQEINTRFDDIVSFSGIATFLDTPVKRYSSGMYVRLAFAVAAHLEPDILLVDEVLAVGDAEFQKKCLGKMQSVVRQGRTILFVSHNMAAVKNLCTRALLLDAGRVVTDGPVDQVVERYLDVARKPSAGGIVPPDAKRSGTGEARIRRVELLDRDDRPVEELYFGQPFRIRMTLEVLTSLQSVIAGVVAAASDGTEVACAFSSDRGGAPYSLSPGWHGLSVELAVPLLPRPYSFAVSLSRTDGYDVDVVDHAARASVLNAAAAGSDGYRWSTVHGFVRAASSWNPPAPLDATEAEAMVAAQTALESRREYRESD
ncbi:MAG: ABC transporter ATP-binding protein [Acidobacteriota bacterium]